MYTPGPWRVNNGAVVSDYPIDTNGVNTGHNNKEYYGGYLIAESIFRDEDRNLIAAAPELFEALIALLDTFSLEEISSFSEERKVAMLKAHEAIAKARGM